MKHRNAFTLIELLVVIAIICIIAAILFPVFATAREKARNTTCLSNLKQLGLACVQYEQDFDDMMPYCKYVGASPQYTWQDALYPYVKAANVYDCPDDGLPPSKEYIPSPPGSQGGSYACNNAFYGNRDTVKNLGPIQDGGATSGWNPISYTSITSPSTTALFFDALSYWTTGSLTWSGMNATPGFNPNQNTNLVYFPSIGPQGANVIGICAAGASSCTNNMPDDTSVDIIARHNGLINVAWCDGHVKSVTPASLLQTAPGSSFPTELIINQ